MDVGEKIIGILGGMGPGATVDLFQKILRATPATKDQEHLRIIIDCNSKIPDRTAHIMRGGENPGSYLVSSARLLEQAGADLIVMPCNAAHAWHDQIRANVRIPVLHIMRAAAEYAAEHWPHIRRIGLLAAPSTVKIGIYHQTFAEKGMEVMDPDQEHQDMTTEAIFAVKAGRTGPDIRRLAVDAGEYLASCGAEAVIAGCTEIPLILGDGDISVPVVDATLALAIAAVRFARGN